MGEVLADTGSHFRPGQLVISIAAGITTSYIEKFIADQVPVIRAMPNTPALVGAGATAVCRGRWASEQHRELALAIFGAAGRAVPVPEKLMDAVTGLSGSGPAYMYIIAEALADAGVRMGLPRDVALTLASQTMLGAARMILETGRHPAVLKDMVTTPGGTTIEGLFALEEGGIRAALYRAVENACRRSGQQSGDNK
jgi:pyrroline-5-carboxylate reductase